ncbi:toll/interleukin-1 receptor domain-containing protein [Croceiramulus getboli]|nr:toll/interleukin-1 receptor domain-containing protein [Flavobacteriaceae bacterium YJPT1-3]
MNKNILLALEGSELVIVLGNDLSLIRLKKNDIPKHEELIDKMASARLEEDDIVVNINEYLAFAIWNEYKQSEEPPTPYNLNNVVELLVGAGITSDDDIKAYIIRIVKNLTDEQIVLEPFRKLAKINNIQTILSVNFDNFLERAFEAEGKKVNPSVNFSIQDNNQLDGTLNHDKSIVSIFNLMGNIQDSDFAVTEEMQLEYLYRLLLGKDEKKGQNTKALFDSVKNKSILFLGCSLPNWFMRFFIRIISKNRYKTGRSKFVASDRTSQDVDLSSFLTFNKTSVIPIGSSPLKTPEAEVLYKNSLEFIDELYEKSEKINTISTDNKPLYKEKVFLSYSWDDKPLIKKLKNEFERCGVQLFFDDDDLRNGENFSETISDYINTCDYVIPLISNNSISRKDSYVYEKEWTQAIYVEKFKKSSGLFREGQDTYIRPYIIDDTSPTDERIPADIRSKNIDSIPSEDDFGEVIRKFIKENLTKIEG